MSPLETWGLLFVAIAFLLAFVVMVETIIALAIYIWTRLTR